MVGRFLKKDQKVKGWGTGADISRAVDTELSGLLYSIQPVVTYPKPSTLLSILLQLFNNQGPEEQGYHCLPYYPLPEPIKQFLFSKISSVSHKILGDKTVLMFCVILIILTDSHDDDIERIRMMYVNMLR